MLCPTDKFELQYRITSDDWWCPKCQTIHVGKLDPSMKDGGKPQLEPHESSDPIHPGTR